MARGAYTPVEWPALIGLPLSAVQNVRGAPGRTSEQTRPKQLARARHDFTAAAGNRETEG